LVLKVANGGFLWEILFNMTLGLILLPSQKHARQFSPAQCNAVIMQSTHCFASYYYLYMCVCLCVLSNRTSKSYCAR